MEINILGIPYKVKEKEIIDHNNDLLGLIVYKDQQIFLKAKMGKEMKQNTLLHEILHGIFLHSGYSELNEKEDLIDSLSNSIYQVLKNNKELITYFS